MLAGQHAAAAGSEARMRPAEDGREVEGLDHQALVYGSTEEFLGAAVPYVREGILGGEPVLARVNEANAGALRGALGADADAVDLQPAEEWHANPIHTRRKLVRWVAEHSQGGRVRMLGEPPWPLAFEPGIREWARHEAILNLVFAEAPVTFVCAHDARSLPTAIVQHAESTHPRLLSPDGAASNGRYTDPHAYCRRLDLEVRGDRSEAASAELEFSIRDLAAVRRLVEREATAAGLTAEGVAGLVLAANELATNALSHGRPPAILRVWHEPSELVVEVTDAGRGIADPMVGQLAPDPTGLGGLGMWIARLMCDAVEVRPGATGTAVAVRTPLPTVL